MSTDTLEENFDLTGEMNSAGAETAELEEASVATTVSDEVKVNAKITTIEVRFSEAVKDYRGRIMPKGKATARFSDGREIVVTVTGGANVQTYGITDPVRNLPVTRIEGKGYKNHLGQPMPYAVFYNRGEALHVGRLDAISHGCVHVADIDRMRRMNLACVRSRTKVSVIYADGVLNKVMQQRL